MKVVPSGIAGVEVYGPGCAEFEGRLRMIPGAGAGESLQPALPFSIIVENQSARAIALLGVRFDMTGPRARQYSVVHYADTLRNPEKADFKPGTVRFVCAEPGYTSLAIRGGGAADTRGKMNLENLRTMLQIRASLDCAAFEDGQFAGPDTQGAFARLARERAAEAAMLSEILAMAAGPIEAIEQALLLAMDDPAKDAEGRARRSVARKLLEGLAAGGRDEMLARARSYRGRIDLWR